MTGNHAATLIDCAVRAMGIMMMPDYAVFDGIQAGRLQPVLPQLTVSAQTAPIDLAILYPPTQQPSLNARAVMDFFLKKFGSPVYWQRLSHSPQSD